MFPSIPPTYTDGYTFPTSSLILLLIFRTNITCIRNRKLKNICIVLRAARAGHAWRAVFTSVHNRTRSIAEISFAPSFIRPLMYSCVRSFIHSFVRSFVPSFVCSFIRSSIHSSVHSSIRSFVLSFFPSFVRLFVRLFVCSFIRSFVSPFVRSFIGSSVCSFGRPLSHPSYLLFSLLLPVSSFALTSSSTDRRNPVRPMYRLHAYDMYTHSRAQYVKR